MSKIPVTVFTGFLGSGKTTLILNLIKFLPKTYKIAYLKNEFGDIKVDSLLFQNENIQVKEMLNGCLCCVLVGRMDSALRDIKDNLNPDRIIIETSGSAYPGPIVWELNKLNDFLYLDGLVNVIDVLNFAAYKDTSFTAKIQTQYTDLIVYNKIEQVDEVKFESVQDSVNELNHITPKIIAKNGQLDPDLIFGLDSKLPLLQDTSRNIEHQDLETDLIEILTNKTIEIATFKTLLDTLPKWDFYRIKGFIVINNQQFLVNYVFGKYTLEKVEVPSVKQTELLILGKNLGFHIKNIVNTLNLDTADYKLKLRKIL
jgi:G3E family GTPase